MDKEWNEITDILLNAALEIIYLLTGEDYIVKKTSGDCVTPIIHLQESGGWSRAPGPITEPPSHLLSNKEKILDLTKKMTELLTGEVPIKCQDLTVDTPACPRKNIGEHQSLCSDVMMKDQQPLTSQDGSSRRNPLKRRPRPLYSQDCPEEDPNVPENQQDENLIGIKNEVIDEDQTDIKADHEYEHNGRRSRYLYSPDCPEEDPNVPENQQGKNLLNIKTEVKDEADETDIRAGHQYGLDERRPHPLYSQDPPVEDPNVPENQQAESLIDIKVKVIDEDETDIRAGLQYGLSERRSRPLYSPDPPKEDLNIPENQQQGEDLTDIKVEVEERMMGYHLCKSEVEEELPVDVAADMSARRKSYSVEYKKGIVEDSLGKNLTAFCKEKMLSNRLVRKWRADYCNLSQQVENGNAKKRKCGSGRQPLFSELEDLICEWVVDRRAKAFVVNRAQIQEFALAMAPQFEIAPEEFKASQNWLDSFLQRSELSLRRSTTLFRLEDAEIIKRAFTFKSFIDDADFSKYDLSNMIAMDETAVFMGQASQTAIEQRGASSVCIPSTAYESARVTCILAIRLDGTKVPPLIISKGKKDKLELVSGIFILETDKAWATQAVIRKWVNLMLPLVMRGSQRGLLVWDAASTHRAKDMKKFLHERKIDQIMIPAGMTAYLQTLDIAINKPFKDNLSMEINNYIENRMEKNQRGNFVKPKLQEVVTWVKNSWEKITDSCIANALRAGYLDKKYSFKDSAIARHERFGPMILKEMESQEIHQEIQGLDCYDDVPEDDDMTIIE